MARSFGVATSLALVLTACSGATPEPTAPTTPPPSQPATTTAPVEAPLPATTSGGGTAATPASTTTTTTTGPLPAEGLTVAAYPVPAGSHPHDVAPAADGTVWYTAQRSGELGRLDPTTGDTRHVALGAGSSPHGVIVGPDGAPWITDSGLNAIVRVDPDTEEVTLFALPEARSGANLNTAAFDTAGTLWFTGQSGVYGRLDPTLGVMEVFDAPRGRGPYGITATPQGAVYYASLAGSFVGAVDAAGATTVLEPPTLQQGSRRVWSDSYGAVWVSEWNVGQVARYDPASDRWQEWRLPGDQPQAYAVYVDEHDQVWLTDFGGNAIVRFDPSTETFAVFALPNPGGEVRQLLGRPGEVWGAESATDHLVVIRPG
jgi:virginiamycin B lyase